MGIKELTKRIADADEDVLQDIITEWLNGHADFRKHVEAKLYPTVDDINFGHELSRKANRETREFFHRNSYTREATDWGNVYYDLVMPWGEQAESFPTQKLYQLVTEIITEVGMSVTEEDFYGDDWYGDDFSGSIGDIMGTLGNIAGLLLVREDVSDEMLLQLEKIVRDAQKSDVIDSYIGGVPYGDILKMIELRRKAGEVTREMYDVMIDADYGRHAGKWLCRQIDFIRIKGMPDEARKVMDAHLYYPDVSLKKHGELMADGNWTAALKVLDEAQKNKENGTMQYLIASPNWLEIKQDLLVKHGSREDQIENLRHLFYASYGEETKKKYYAQLKSMIPSHEWKAFYHKLLTGVTGYDTLDTIAPFLIEEGELSWLYRLVGESEKRDTTDYRTPLRYAYTFSSDFRNETASQLVRTFRAYAADRFRPKKQVNTDKYSYFRADLEKLGEFGYAHELKELVEYFLVEYRFRPALVKVLKAIKLLG